MKKIILISIFMLLLTACSQTSPSIKSKYQDAHIIELNGTTATIDGESIKEYNYTWCIDNTKVHGEVKDSPAEYHTGEKPEDTIYIDHDLVYYPYQDESNFKLVNYDG